MCYLQRVSALNEDLTEQSSHAAQLESTCETLKKQVSTTEVSIDQESSKVKQLEAELMTADVMREGLSREVEKVLVKLNLKIPVIGNKLN